MINTVGTGKLKLPRRGRRKAFNLSHLGKHLLCASPSSEGEQPGKMALGRVVQQAAQAGTARSSGTSGMQEHQHGSLPFSCQ